LADADGLQHACVPQLPEHQGIVETQWELRERESSEIAEREREKYPEREGRRQK
jgi:hypothetical protein